MTTLVCSLAVFGGIALCFFAVDWFVAFNQWQSRIHIGCWGDMETWQKAIEGKARKWLCHTPTVKVKDQDRLVLWDMIRGKYRSETIQSWQKAGLLMGLNSCGHPISPERLSAIINPATGNLSFEPRQIDVALLGYAVLKTRGIDKERIKPAMDRIYHLIMEAKGSNATVPYRKGIESIRFVDSLGMICPFLSCYGITYSCAEATELAFMQLKEYDVALHPATHFPAHAFDLEKNVPLGIFSWGSGIGWYVLALTEMYRTTCDEGHKNFLKDRLCQVGTQMLRFQLPTGGFSQQVFLKHLCPEATATVLAGLLFQTCFDITSDVKYKVAVEKVLKQLMRLTRRNGCLDFCQGDTKGIGIYSTSYSYMPFAQGLCLLLINRYKNANS